jgi:hypothetical protein
MADISNAYLQGKENDRVILYRIPKDGIPEEGVAGGTVILARVPIYGTADAGRGFWLKLKEVILEQGYSLNQILPTMFTLRKEGKIIGVLSSNVDDILHGETEEGEQAVQKILDTFAVREQQEGSFRFCGKEVEQDENFNIKVTAKDNTEKIKPIDIGVKRKLTDKCDAGETTALRSVTASLAWIARQVRPALSYKVSKLQCIAGNGRVRDLRQANKVLDQAFKTSEEGLYFSSDFNWDDCVVASITDASFGNEEEVVKGDNEAGRSQQGHILCLAPADVVNLDVATVHPIAWSSTVIRRVCRATLQAETMALTKGVEAGARLRAAIVDMRGRLNLKDWEQSSSSQMGHVWFTDCDSLYEHLISPKNNSVDNKRLAIDLMALRQYVWERNGERSQYIEHSCGDYPRWIDTSTMIADPLTKSMDPTRLVDTLMTGKLDLRPTPESLAIKAKNRQLRKNKKENEKRAQEVKQKVVDEEQERQEIRKNIEEKKIKAINRMKQNNNNCGPTSGRHNNRW